MIAFMLPMPSAQAAALDGAETAQWPSAVEDVVVTARPGPPRPLPDAVDYVRRFCFDPLRLTGRFAPPTSDAEWSEVSGEARGGLGAADTPVSAYGLFDPVRGHTLLAKFELAPGKKGWNVVEERCTLVVIGGRDHGRLRGDMDALFGASGTQRYLGERDGAPKLPDWDQWMWSGMPGRRAGRWTALKRDARGNESARLVVFDPDFYDRYDYIMGDLKTRKGASRPLSMLSFVRIRRVTQHKKGRPPAGPPSPVATRSETDQKSR